jgi:hypothetical protein
MTQYSVNEQLELVKGPTLSFLDLGFSGGGVPAFASEHLAYVLAPDLDVIVKYDPSTMEIIGTIDVAPLDRPMLESYGVDYYRFGKSMVWLLNSENGETQKIHRGVTLLVLDLVPERRGMASSLQAFVGSSANGLVAGLVAPLVMHSAIALAATSLAMMSIGVIAWLVVKPHMRPAAALPRVQAGA